MICKYFLPFLIVFTFIISFEEYKFYILIKSNFFHFNFGFSDIFEKPLPNSKQKKSFRPRFILSLIGLALKFRSTICFESMLACGVKQGSTFILCMKISNCLSTNCRKDYSSSIELSWHLYQKSIDHKCKGFISQFIPPCLSQCQILTINNAPGH